MKTDYTLEKGFWHRLEMFVKNVQVNDAMSEEEKGMILHMCELKAYQQPSKVEVGEVKQELINRIDIIKEWLNPNPFSDIDAAVNGINKLKERILSLYPVKAEAKSDAVEFAEWIKENEYKKDGDGWAKQYSSDHSSTTQELYLEFKKGVEKG